VTNTSILEELANTNDVISLESPKNWYLNNQVSKYNLYIHFSTIFYYSLTILAQFLVIYTNVIAVTRNFVILSSIVYIAQYNNKFVLPVLPIAENLYRCNRALCITYKGKETSYGHSYNNKWFLDSSVFAYFTFSKSEFVFVTNFIWTYLY